MSSSATDGAGPVAVTPRAHRMRSKANLPIDQLVLPIVRSKVTGLVSISAPPGGGKTTALHHLKAVLPTDAAVEFFESHQSLEAKVASSTALVLLAASEPVLVQHTIDVFQLSPWTIDDCMEYLLSRYRPQCRSVLDRLRRDASFAALEGSPQLLTLVMDAMAANESLANCRDILQNHLRQVIPPGLTRDRLMVDGDSSAASNENLWRWWRHSAIQQIALADWIVERLCDGIVSEQLKKVEPAMISAIAAGVRQEPRAADRLRQLVELHPSSAAVPMAASVLVAADPDWCPHRAGGLNLVAAQLGGARWATADLANSNLRGTNFSGADLSGANFAGAFAPLCDFTGASLRGANFPSARFRGALFSSADLSGALASKSDFSEADLKGANLAGAECQNCQFDKSDLSGANARKADFSGANFAGVALRDADCAGASFLSATLEHIDLSEAVLKGACFAGVKMIACNLERVEIPDADFAAACLAGCLLTGSRIPNGQFRNADLSGAGMAEIDWTNADLRDANFTNASFHMGSTRSGLVGSSIAGEGSRTGFYTDDYYDQKYKPPEEIRKACLYGANLQGATVNRTDFYLVDLRMAVYSSSQAKHFARTGAILSYPSEGGASSSGE